MASSVPFIQKGRGSPQSPQIVGQPSPGTSPRSFPQVVNAAQPYSRKILQDILDCLKDLKSDYEARGQPITDDNQTLHRFCAKLEYLLQAGMKEKVTLLGRKKDYWDYFCDCLGSTKGVNDGIKYVKTIGDYKTSIGKGRALLRFCLMHNRMADSIQQCITNGKVTSDWYNPTSLWLHHDDHTTIISALYDLNDIQFDLAPRGYDLDNAWPSFARKNLSGVNSWNPPSRTSSMSSLLSIPGQDTSSLRHGLSSTPNDSDLDHLTSDSMHADLMDKMEALEQQKLSFQQSVISSQGELGLLQDQHRHLKSAHDSLTTEHRDVQQRFDRLILECGTREKEWQMKEEMYTKQLDMSRQETEALRSKVTDMEGKVHLLDTSRKDSDVTNMVRIAELEQVKMDLVLQVRTLQQDTENRKIAESKNTEAVQSMEHKLEHSEAKVSGLLDKLKSVVENKNEAASFQMDSVSQLQTVLVSLKESDADNLKLKGDILELANQCVQKDQELAMLEGRITDLTSHRESEQHSAQLEIETLRKKLEMETLRMTQDLQSLQDLSSTQTQEKDDRIGELESENEKLCMDIQTNGGDVEKLKVLADDLKSKLSNSEESRNFESSRLQESLKHLTAENSELKTTLDGLNQQISEKEDKILVLTRKLEESTRTVKEERKHREGLEGKVRNLQGELMGQEIEIKSLVEQQTLEKGSANEVKTALQEKMTAIRKLEAKERQFLQSMNWLHDTIESGSYTKNPTKMEDTNLSKVFHGVVQKMAEKEKKIANLESSQRSLVQQCDSLRVEKEEHRKQYLQTEKNMETLKGSLSDSQQNVQVLTDQNSDLKKNVKKLTEKRDKLTESLKEKENVIVENETKTNKLSEEVARLGKEFNEKSAALLELQNSLSVSEEKLRQNSDTQKKSNQHEESMSVTIKSLQSELAKEQDKGKRMHGELDKSRTKLSETESELKNLVDKKVIVDKKYADLCKKSDDLTHNNQRFKKSIELLTEEKRQLEQKLTEVKSHLFDSDQKLSVVRTEKEEREKSHQQVLERLQGERQDLTENLEEAMTDLGSIKQQLEQTSRELENTYHLKDQLEAERNDVMLAKVTMEATISQLQGRSEGLHGEVKDQKVKVSEMAAKCDGLQSEKTKLMTEKEGDREEIERLGRNLADAITEKDEGQAMFVSLEAELKAMSENLNQMQKELEEKLSQQEKQTDILREEKSELLSTIESLRNELDDRTRYGEELESTIKSSSATLEGLQQSVSEKDRHVTELEENLMTMEENFQQERDTLKQEVTALQFQNSAEQIQYEHALQSYSSQESNISELKDKLMEQEGLIEQLEREMGEIKSAREREKGKQTHEVENLRSRLKTRDLNKEDLQDKLSVTMRDLEAEKSLVISLKSQLGAAKGQLQETGKESQGEISQLKSDTEQLKKKLVKLVRDKDSLWQKSDQLAYQQKEKVREKWIDDRTVLNCLGCKIEFSFTLRKHHCRICGKIFCFNCCNNWILTAHSSKKSRACNLCYLWYSHVESESSTPDADHSDFEDTVELPHCKFRSSRSQSLEQELDCPTVRLDDPNVMAGLMSESTSTVESSEPTDRSSMDGSKTDTDDSPSGIVPGQVATDITIALVGENETDELKVKKSGTREDEGGAAAMSKDDIFHLISEEEITKSLTMSGESQPVNTDPNLSTNLTISTEELEKGQINSTNEVAIKAGRKFAVPVMVDRVNTMLCWEFTSQPKDIVFSVSYLSQRDLPLTSAQTLVPSCKCDSHKQAVKGELTAKQLGIYTLTFDNTYSRLTTKTVSYTLWTR